VLLQFTHADIHVTTVSANVTTLVLPNGADEEKDFRAARLVRIIGAVLLVTGVLLLYFST
jgi:hypothetical protein